MSSLSLTADTHGVSKLTVEVMSRLCRGYVEVMSRFMSRFMSSVEARAQRSAKYGPGVSQKLFIGVGCRLEYETAGSISLKSVKRAIPIRKAFE